MQSVSTIAQSCAIKAEAVRIQWNPTLPVFAKEEFLRAVGDDYGWLGGIDPTGALRCVLPYTITRNAGLRLLRFRAETIPLGERLDLGQEKSFLNSAVQCLRSMDVDAIIPPTNNAVFRTHPDGALPAPYGSYGIDLQQEEEALWKNVSKTTRQNINTAKKDGVSIREGTEFVDAAYDLIRSTFKRSKMGFMHRAAFQRLVSSLGGNAKILMAEYQGVPQSYSLFAFSSPCAYWVYGGNVERQHQGAMKLLQWEAIRLFRAQGVRRLDFYGARINPPKGSKQEGINLMKKNLGATLSQGYVWKYSLRPFRASLYSLAVRLLRGGDIVDQEAHKLKDYTVSLEPEIA